MNTINDLNKKKSHLSKKLVPTIALNSLTTKVAIMYKPFKVTGFYMMGILAFNELINVTRKGLNVISGRCK